MSITKFGSSNRAKRSADVIAEQCITPSADGNCSVSGKRLRYVGKPEHESDAANKAYVDASHVDVAIAVRDGAERTQRELSSLVTNVNKLHGSIEESVQRLGESLPVLQTLPDTLAKTVDKMSDRVHLATGNANSVLTQQMDAMTETVKKVPPAMTRAVADMSDKISTLHSKVGEVDVQQQKRLADVAEMVKNAPNPIVRAVASVTGKIDVLQTRMAEQQVLMAECKTDAQALKTVSSKLGALADIGKRIETLVTKTDGLETALGEQQKSTESTRRELTNLVTNINKLHGSVDDSVQQLGKSLPVLQNLPDTLATTVDKLSDKVNLAAGNVNVVLEKQIDTMIETVKKVPNAMTQAVADMSDKLNVLHSKVDGVGEQQQKRLGDMAETVKNAPLSLMQAVESVMSKVDVLQITMLEQQKLLTECKTDVQSLQTVSGKLSALTDIEKRIVGMSAKMSGLEMAVGRQHTSMEKLRETCSSTEDMSPIIARMDRGIESVRSDVITISDLSKAVPSVVAKAVEPVLTRVISVYGRVDSSSKTVLDQVDRLSQDVDRLYKRVGNGNVELMERIASMADIPIAIAETLSGKLKDETFSHCNHMRAYAKALVDKLEEKLSIAIPKLKTIAVAPAVDNMHII